MRVLGLFALLGVAVVSIVLGQATSTTPDHGFLTQDDMKWGPGPASLPPGTKAAVLEGDPAKEGPFTLRLQLPEGYTIQPHSHPSVEHVTVISGTFNLGMGEKFDKSGGRALTAGSFAFMQPGMRHFAWTTGETVINCTASDRGRSITLTRRTIHEIKSDVTVESGARSGGTLPITIRSNFLFVPVV